MLKASVFFEDLSFDEILTIAEKRCNEYSRSAKTEIMKHVFFVGSLKSKGMPPRTLVHMTCTGSEPELSPP